MALHHELDTKDMGPLSDASKGAPWGEIIRDYVVEPEIQWRFGKPNYARVNKSYFEHRSKRHAEGSLEQIVTKLVKNWEVESHHVADFHQWKTMNISKFEAMVNGGCPASAQIMADIGPYNPLLGETNHYSSKANTFESANQNFSSTFTQGYASGPPTVTFKWRHFGNFTGTFTDKSGKTFKGNGQMTNLIGLCIAKVDADLVIESLDVYYNPEDLIAALTSPCLMDAEGSGRSASA
eukprot:CAMPEP_0168357628 /NCGR_PEP_ID=MMETSP0228-20121227/690_1 /TAXON_ID=133427 /ORGANISM="Protoceratium reticulatum, Strain CCCM 535 (=CCMP 1889)" /LENGTH=236 /DNA_ID=CAMNT_0008370163 /DNA_START=27 /DNA_END=734 /DNA_ORIENTATION=+